MVKEKRKVANHFNQDTVAECKAIKRIIEESNINIKIIRVDSHKKITTSFLAGSRSIYSKNVLQEIK